MNNDTNTVNIEPRWPVVVAIVGVTLLLLILPDSIRLLPVWGTYVLGFVVLAPIIAVGLTRGGPRCLRLERLVTLVFFIIAAVLLVTRLAKILHVIIYASTEISGVDLLAASVGAWLTNVLIFALLYWQMDRGGPEARVHHAGQRTDWLFPQESAPEEDVPAGWRAAFVDYFYLAYQTATAFSTTDVLPLTPRAKLLMMLESTISLATILIVAARAINVLGS